MKHIVGVSLGSSQRDHAVTMNLGGTECRIERFGTDGDVKRIISLIEEYDGKVDALGLGGIDLYIYAVDRRYEFRDARKIVQRAKKTPIVDGSGVKHVLERRVIMNSASRKDPWKKKKVDHIVTLLKGALLAEQKVMLKMNVHCDNLGRVTALLPALRKPTVSALSEDQWVAVESVVEERAVRDLIYRLKEAGAEGIVEFPLNKIIP